MGDILKIGLDGMTRGMAVVADSAQRITAAAGEGDFELVVKESVDLNADKRQIQASAKVIKVGAELQDEVLNIIA